MTFPSSGPRSSPSDLRAALRRRSALRDKLTIGGIVAVALLILVYGAYAMLSG
jgi:hypothetical protein